jgi:hypothetical protein
MKLLLFRNNLGHSIHMLKLFTLWHMPQCKCHVAFKKYLIYNFNIKLVGT